MWQSSPGLPRPFVVTDAAGNTAIYGHETGDAGVAVSGRADADEATGVLARAFGTDVDGVIANASGLRAVAVLASADGTDSRALQITGAIAVNQAAVHGLGSYTGKALPLYDTHSGALLGYVPIYDVTS